VRACTTPCVFFTDPNIHQVGPSDIIHEPPCGIQGTLVYALLHSAIHRNAHIRTIPTESRKMPTCPCPDTASTMKLSDCSLASPAAGRPSHTPSGHRTQEWARERRSLCPFPAEKLTCGAHVRDHDTSSPLFLRLHARCTRNHRLRLHHRRRVVEGTLQRPEPIECPMTHSSKLILSHEVTKCR
jgi:hypothetical protein